MRSDRYATAASVLFASARRGSGGESQSGEESGRASAPAATLVVAAIGGPRHGGTCNVATTVAGRCPRMTMRSARYSASSTSCVTITTVGPTVAEGSGEQVLHLHARQRVQRRERLVQQQDARLADKRAGQRRPLGHAARQLVRIGASELVQADPLQNFRGRERMHPGCAAPARYWRRPCAKETAAALGRRPRSADQRSRTTPAPRRTVPAVGRSRPRDQPQ